MNGFLDAMAAGSSRRVTRARETLPEIELRARLRDRAAAPRLRLDPEGFDLIAEIKPCSPSAGSLLPSPHEPADVARFVRRQATAYEAGGACAISVLTEPERFDGSLGYLAAAVGAVDVPVMRKDFLVDPYQVLEARLFGAAGVLLIARLEPERLREMVEQALELGMFTLIEAFDEADIAIAAEVYERIAPRADQGLLGINARDLKTLQVDPDRLHRLRPHLPNGAISVAESGLVGCDDVARVAREGYRAALVGTALMQNENPEQAVSQRIEAGRHVRRVEVMPCT